MGPYEKLTAYVNAASDLAEQMSLDLKHGDMYTNQTITALSKFVSTANAVKDMLDVLEDRNINLN